MKYKTLQLFAAESGYTERAIRTKIQRGVWPEGVVWVKAPDGPDRANFRSATPMGFARAVFEANHKELEA